MGMYELTYSLYVAPEGSVLGLCWLLGWLTQIHGDNAGSVYGC